MFVFELMVFKVNRVSDTGSMNMVITSLTNEHSLSFNSLELKTLMSFLFVYLLHTNSISVIYN